VSDPGPEKKLATNRKAFRDYTILDRFEAGIALKGTEVKSIRAGSVDFAGSYAGIVKGEVILTGMRIAPYSYSSSILNHDETRPRRLLLHRNQIRKLQVQLDQKGMTVVPLSAYVNSHNKVKIEIGVCKGKQAPDKRNDLRKKTADRETARAISQSQKNQR
jgi:SsrA-binding protein